MSEKVRVAVVGTGEWWGREHARLFSRRKTPSWWRWSGRTER